MIRMKDGISGRITMDLNTIMVAKHLQNTDNVIGLYRQILKISK